jgi:response regulator RpfG family c-di-GMP phosphodiesterase
MKVEERLHDMTASAGLREAIFRMASAAFSRLRSAGTGQHARRSSHSAASAACSLSLEGEAA